MYIRSFILFIFIVSVSCGNSVIESIAGDPKRPKLKDITSWPDSLVIETFYYGGMSPESNRVIIRKDSCIVESRWGQIQNRYAFIPKQSELDELLVQLNKYAVDKINLKQREGTIYDAPTSGFSIQLGNKFISLSDGATEVISERREGDFRNCCNLLNAYSAKGIESYKRKVCITIDKSLQKHKDYSLSIIPENGAAYWDTIAQVKPEVCFDLLQGKYPFQIHITRPGAYSYNQYVASIYPELDVKENQSLKLVLKNDSTLELK